MPTVKNILELKQNDDPEKAHICIQLGRGSSDYVQYHLYAKNDTRSDHPSKIKVSKREAKAIAAKIKELSIEGVIVEGILKEPIKRPTEKPKGVEASVEIN